MRNILAPGSDRFDTESIHNLSGAVFAFAMTLLILSLVVPPVPKGAPEAVLAAALRDLWPHVLTYFISFGLIASYWVMHRRIFTFIRVADRTFLWMNLYFLMFIAFMPFAAELMGSYPRYRVALLAYAGTALVTLLLQHTVWAYAVGRGRLVDPDLDPRWIAHVTMRTRGAIALVLVCIGVSYFDPLVSLATLILMPVLGMLPLRIAGPAPVSGEPST
ncbi:MAG TPA: TMEM175 family protein [bacterium]|nr:TMEM175 family protein [bacterium]